MIQSSTWKRLRGHGQGDLDEGGLVSLYKRADEVA